MVNKRNFLGPSGEDWTPETEARGERHIGRDGGKGARGKRKREADTASVTIRFILPDDKLQGPNSRSLSSHLTY